MDNKLSLWDLYNQHNEMNAILKSHGHDINNITGLSEVAVTGSFNDLNNIPNLVNSVQGQIGDVNLTAEDVGAIPVSASCNKLWNWVLKSDQPNYIWGGNEKSTMYIYNPATFKVSSAITCETANNSKLLRNRDIATEVDSVNSNILNIKSEIQNINSKVNNINDNTVVDINNNIDLINSSILNINEQIKSTNSNIDGIKLIIDNSGMEIDDINNKINLVNSDIEKTNNNLSKLSETVSGEALKIAQVTKKVDLAGTEIININNRIKNINAEIDGIKQSVSNNELEISNVSNKINTANSQIKIIDDSVNTLTQSVSNNTSAINTVSSKIDTTNLEVKTISNDVGSLKQSVSNISLSVDKVNTNITGINGEITNLKSSVVNGKQEVINAINDRLGYASGLNTNHTHSDYAWWIRNVIPRSAQVTDFSDKTFTQYYTPMKYVQLYANSGIITIPGNYLVTMFKYFGYYTPESDVYYTHTEAKRWTLIKAGTRTYISGNANYKEVWFFNPIGGNIKLEYPSTFDYVYVIV